jgi:hypothetical protein
MTLVAYSRTEVMLTMAEIPWAGMINDCRPSA